MLFNKKYYKQIIATLESDSTMWPVLKKMLRHISDNASNISNTKEVQLRLRSTSLCPIFNICNLIMRVCGFTFE